MNIDNIVEVLKSNAEKHPNDSRQIIKYKNNVIFGNEFGVILSNVDGKIFEVFIHATINKEVISQIVYTTFNNINEANKLYEELEEYIINNDIKSIIDRIQKRDKK